MTEVFYINKKNIVQTFIYGLPFFAACYGKIHNKFKSYEINTPYSALFSIKAARNFLNQTQEEIINIFGGKMAKFTNEEVVEFINVHFLYLVISNDVTAVKSILENTDEKLVQEMLKAENCSYTPICEAALYGNAEIIKMLLEKGSHTRNLESAGAHMVNPLFLAARSGSLDAVKVLIEAGADVDQPLGCWGYCRGDFAHNPLHIACNRGHVEIVKFLIENGADVNLFDKEYEKVAPMHEACMSGNIEVVKLLLDAGADINCYSPQYYYPINEACHYGDIELVKFLIENGANINAKGNPAICDAIYWGNEDIAKYLLQFDTELYVRHDDKYSDFHTSALNTAADKSSVELCKMLIDRGMNVNYVDDFECTPLDRAALRGKTDVIKLLITHGAKVNPKDRDGYTPLETAIKYNEDNQNLDAIKYLLPLKSVRVNKKKIKQIISEEEATPELKEILEKYGDLHG